MLRCCADGSSERQKLQLKLLRTAVGQADGRGQAGGDPREVMPTKDALLLRCGDGRILQVGLFRLLHPAAPTLVSTIAAISRSCARLG